MCDNHPQVYRETVCRARKQYNCCECRIPILKGEYYVYSSGIWEDGPESFKTCLRCHELRQELADPDDYCRVPFGEVRDYWLEAISSLEYNLKFIQVCREAL